MCSPVCENWEAVDEHALEGHDQLLAEPALPAPQPEHDLAINQMTCGSPAYHCNLVPVYKLFERCFTQL